MFNAKLSTQKNKNITLMKYKAGFGVKIKMLIMQFISISALRNVYETTYRYKLFLRNRTIIP
ncbi:hypothetical protein BMR09_17500, partial [Methylococcaceae bacterium CS3]